MEKKRAPKATGPSERPDAPLQLPTWELFDDEDIDAMTVDELRDWVRKLDRMAGQRDQLLQAVPWCPHHGPCIPHALAWIEKAKAAGIEPVDLPTTSADDVLDEVASRSGE